MTYQTLARHVNELRVLTTLRTQGPTTRADIARRLSLTPATITNVVDDLVRRELVLEIKRNGARGRGELGRPGVAVALNPVGAYFFGAEIGVGIVRFALLDMTAQTVEASSVRVPKSITATEAVKVIRTHEKYLERKRKFRGRIRAAGVTVPGLVRSDGFVVHLPILGWKDVNLLERLRDNLRLDVLVENNANAAALGAAYSEPGLSRDCVMFVKLGTGCGGAAIVNGRLLRGASGTATELGHVRVADSGPLCSCGHTGCLESFVNIVALARAYDPQSGLSPEGLLHLPALVARRASKGEVAAQKAAASIGDYLSKGLVTLVNIFNPSAVIIGGTMRPVVQIELDRLRGSVAAGIVPGMTTPDIRLSRLDEFECAIGAAAMAYHRSFDPSNIEMARAADLPDRAAYS